MRNILRMVLLLFSSIACLQAQGTPNDCAFSATFTSATTGNSITNSNIPCASWRVTYTSTGFSALSIQFETSPDNSNWTPVTSTICSAAVQPPCVIDGANPSTTTGSGTFAVRAYGKYVRLNVTSVTGSGSIATTVYGYKGLSAQAGSSGSAGPAGPTGPAGAAATASYCPSASASTSIYTATCTPTLSASTAGIAILWTPDVTAAAGVITLDADGTGAKAIRLSDGITTPVATNFIKANSYQLVSDGTSWRLNDSNIELNFISIPPPAQPTSALGAAGTITTTAVVYYVTCVTPFGETLESVVSSPGLAPSSQRITVTIGTCTEPRTSGRNIYRGSAGDSGGPYRLTSYAASPTVANNTTTSYSDNAAANSLSSNPRLPSVSQTSWIFKDGLRMGFLGRGPDRNVNVGGVTTFGAGTPAGPWNEAGIQYMVAIGDLACNQCTSVPGTSSSMYNTVIGSGAGRTHTSGDDFTAVGTVAGEQQIGSRLTAIGSHSLRGSSNTASGNTAIGAYALNAINNNAAVSNTAVGDGAGELATSATLNALLGQSAGKITTKGPSGTTLTTQSKDTLLGTHTSLQGGYSTCTAIGYGASCVGSNRISLGGYPTGTENEALGFYGGLEVDGMPVMAVPKVNLTGQTATVGTTNLRCGLTGGVTAVVCPAGLYRVSLYLVVTATGTGTLTTTVGWNDGTAARTIVSTGVATTATNYEQNSYVVKLDGTNDLTYATTLTVSGTYVLAIRVEKIEQ